MFAAKDFRPAASKAAAQSRILGDLVV
jgi:hypothetical protein